MIHWISVSNFQSIRDEVTLDFRVPRTTPESVWLRNPSSTSDVRVPTVIALIGPNGSGKTAWLRALAETVRFVTQSYGFTPGSIGYFPAFASQGAWVKPTRIEIECDAPGLHSSPDGPNCIYRYALELQRSEPDPCPDTVSYEALHVFPRGRPRRLFERRGNQPVRVARDVTIKQSDDRLTSVPPNASVISTLARMGVDSFSVIVEMFSQVPMNVAVLDPMMLPSEAVTKYFQNNPDVKNQLSDKLGRFDLGIKEMEVRQLNDGKLQLMFSHSGVDLEIPLAFESDGTRRVVNLFPQLHHALETGKFAVFDGLDNDLHADLVDEILSWFRRKDTNKHDAQLICSLHSLSALEALEKEEVFIIEKDREGVTGAYGARDVQGVRRIADLRKLYSGGALGGLPSFG